MTTADNTTRRNTIRSLLVLPVLLCAATGIGYIFKYVGFHETNIVIIYILSVLITALFTPIYALDILASLLAALTFNFFFTEPYYTLTMSDPGYIVSFIIMTITALITSALTVRVQKSVQKAREKEAEAEKERYRGNLLRSISHDIRTPLAIILGSSTMLKDVAGEKEAVEKIADDIYKEADWLHTLVENILNLTRLQEGRLLPQAQPQAVEEVIGFAISSISRRYPGVEITVNAPDDLLVIPMDAKLVSQVFINLLDNAVRHTQKTSGISITVSTGRESVYFVIADEGPGLSEEDIPNLFDMFFTTPKRRSETQHGIGLGLTICKAIINAHGGWIVARNRTDGVQGAIFEFTLPTTEMRN